MDPRVGYLFLISRDQPIKVENFKRGNNKNNRNAKKASKQKYLNKRDKNDNIAVIGIPLLFLFYRSWKY